MQNLLTSDSTIKKKVFYTIMNKHDNCVIITQILGETMNKNIIIAILAVIIIACVGGFMFAQQPFGKQGTQIQFTSGNTLQNGEQVQFQLKDAQGNALAGQTVNIVFDNEKFTITTDQEGKGYITLTGENAGNYEVEVTYDGNDKYAPCNAKFAITITDGLTDDTVAQTSSDATTGSSASSGNSSDNGWPAYDSNGISREYAEKMGWTYTSEHGGHYIGQNDHWDENANCYHD